jgi:hypothetical protein
LVRLCFLSAILLRAITSKSAAQNSKKIVYVLVAYFSQRASSLLFLSLALLLIMGGANAATDDEKKQCLQYDKEPVTLTGTVLVRKIDYGKDDDAPPEGSVPFPLLILDQPICTWGTDDESEFLQWALHIADKCARTWPSVSRVKVSGTLYHGSNWHHHSHVLILAKQIVRLDGPLPACPKDSER